MHRIIIEISLVAVLMLSGNVFSAEAQKAGNAAPGSGDRVRLQAAVERVRARIELGRSLNEFADELSLFDNQLYGRLQNRDSGREQINELKAQIRDTNGLLGQTRNQLDAEDGKFGGAIAPDSPNDILLEQEARRLEGELAEMNRQLETLQLTELVSGSNALLDENLWQASLSGLEEVALEELIETLIPGGMAPVEADSGKAEAVPSGKENQNAGEPK